MPLTPINLQRAAMDMANTWMRTLQAEAEAEALKEQLGEAQAQLKEFTNGVEKPAKMAPKSRAKASV